MSNKSDISSSNNKRKCLFKKNFKRLGYIFMIEAAKRKSLKAKRKQERQNKRKGRK